MKKKSIYIGISVYAIVMVLILLCSVLYLTFVLKEISLKYSVSVPQYIYVEPNSSPLPPTNAPSEDESGGWLVKEYEGKIGIFKNDGTLLQIIDTYIKTLPEADRRMLGEGFEIQTQAELNAIIEDYSD